MPNVSSFGAQTDNAVVSGTVTDRQMIIPEVPPQGLMSIGPRQSPNYIKEPWNAQTSYVFYDVVKDGAGASYVATKPVVPAGTALTNEDYWFKWADPNAQINELNEVVKTFNERIAQNASAITAEVARATAAEDGKAPTNHASEETVYGIGNELNYGHVKLAADDTPMTSDANAGVAATPKMVQQVTKLKRNRPTLALYIGNSYTDGVGSTDNRGIFELTKDMFDKAYKFTSGGAGFCHYTNQSGNKSFEDLINDATLSQDYMNADVTHIVFVGAWGETGLMAEKSWNAINDIKSKAEDVSKLCKQKFPNVERMVYYWAESRLKPYTNNNLFWEFAVHNYAPYMFHSSEIEYIGWGGWDLLYNKTCFSADGYHPNSRGYNILANNFRTAFNGALTYQAFSKTVKDEPMNSIIEGSTMTYKIELTPSETRIEFGKINQTNVPASYTHFKNNKLFNIISMGDDFAFPAPTDVPGIDIGHIVKYISDYTYSDVQKTARINMLVKTQSNNNASVIMLYAYQELSGTKSNNSFSSVTYFENPIVTIPFETIRNRV